MTADNDQTSQGYMDLNTPPDRVPLHPPVITRAPVLPFGELTWENFERLCYRLAGQSDRIEHVARYGRQGQAQQGIDLFARLPNGKYEIWQAKRYASVTAGDVKGIVETFLAGTWAAKAETLVLAVQASLADTKIQDEIERQAAELKKNGVVLLPRGGEELSEMLRGFPELVDDFFGRGWVEEFLGPEVAVQLGARLDGAEFAKVRSQLRRYYDAHFHLLDVGISLPLAAGVANDATPSLLQRFTIPDVLVRDTISDEERPPSAEKHESGGADGRPNWGAHVTGGAATTRRRDYVRRTPLPSWFSAGRQLAIVGEAGSGKSTLLRCVALDVLLDQSTFPEISRRAGQLLPVHVSFSRWSRISARLGRAAGLKEVVAEVLQPALTADFISLVDRAIDERRVLLLLDGLDEWSDEQAARTALQHILAFVATHDVPVIASARPRGLDKIGVVPRTWKVAELAPLSKEQQRQLAEVWFSRSAARASQTADGDETRAPIDARLDRFFTELGRDRRLTALAGNPLLLVGLVTLSLRQIALPRNKTQAIENLVGILIESHPQQRATAAGDTQPRFTNIPNAEDRRAVLGRMAFIARSTSGGGSFDVREARRTIKDYLADPEKFAFQQDQAQRAAEELLAVNAETVGLLTERAPGEIAFAHAAFEEFLSAEHIRTWPFSEITAFVDTNSGEPLWRNVIANLLALIDRPSEVQDLVAVIERARVNDSSREGVVSRDVLLADIAFGPSRKPPATAQRLTEAAVETIERGDWMLVRREVLKSALANLGDPAVKSPLDARIARWTPRREKYLYRFFDALSKWAQSPELKAALIGGLHGEDRSTRRSAARALAHVYKGDADIQARLLGIVKLSLDLSVNAAVLQALSLGWPDRPELAGLHDRALKSMDATLRLIGISGRAASGRADVTDRDALVELLSEFPEIDFWDKPDARELLWKTWPHDPALIDLSLRTVRRRGPLRREFERETAMGYLIRCAPSNQAVADWVREELKQQYPFSLMHDDVWDRVVPFALTHEDIRAAVIATIKSDWGRHSLHHFQEMIVALLGNDLRDFLIVTARNGQGWEINWAIRALVLGWDRSDPVVANFLDEITKWDDAKLSNLASLLPKIITDAEECKARLLRFANQSEGTRFDLIAPVMAEIGYSADDIVERLISKVGVGAPLFDPSFSLLLCFPKNSQVRALAIRLLAGQDPPLAAIAAAFKDDLEVRNLVLAFANPLPVALRGDIADMAPSEAASRACFNSILENYDNEVDAELKISTSISYHRNMSTQPDGVPENHLETLRADLHAVGPELNERRAAAFAGMLLLGRVGDVVAMSEYGDKPLNIRSGSSYDRESDSLMALMAERWEEISSAFGPGLPARFGDFGADEGHMWDCLAPHINASEPARRDFMAFVDSTDTTLGLKSFVALARDQSSSAVLLKHCWRVLGQQVSGQHARHSDWAVERIRLEIAYILRDQYRAQSDVLTRLQELAKRPRRPEVVALLLSNPSDPLLDQIQWTSLEIGQQHSDWVTALHLAAVRSSPEDFVEVVLAMINRSIHSNWDFQEIVNRAVVERLAGDAASVQLLKNQLLGAPTTSEMASLPQYLSAANVLDADIRLRCTELLRQQAEEPMAQAGYDAFDDSIRAVSLSLLEVVTPSLSP
jgi:energy-coupling factor transporter ATP-binding protein EcfA2